MVVQDGIVNVIQVLRAEISFAFLDALFSQGNRLGLPIDLIIVVFFQSLDETIGPHIHRRRASRLTRNDQRCPRLIDQNRIDFIDDRVIQRPLNHLFLVDHHVIPQIVKPEFAVRGISDITIVSIPLLIGVLAVQVQANAQAQPMIEFAHFFRVTT